MKKKIAILGSTGSIGKTTFKIILKDKKKFDIKLLTTNKNYKLIVQQAKIMNVKNVLITDKKNFLIAKKKYKKTKIRIYNGFREIKKIFKFKIDYTMCAISGLAGLEPTLDSIKYSKRVAIANKESIICGWNLIKKELTKNKTEFVPVDSEHFSIQNLLNSNSKDQIKKIIITASGGPFLKKKITNKIKISDALKHPNWKMGKKITIDSSTLMNKVFEVMEAKKIFNLSYDKIKILINPNSYLHAIIIFNNGTIKLLAHETKMDIPIFNSIYDKVFYKKYKTNDIDLKKINSINLGIPSLSKFKSLKILNKLPKNDTLFETVLISTNDELVNMFLNKKIKYPEILNYLLRIINFKNFQKYCNVKPSSTNQIYATRNYVKKFVNAYIKLKKT
tara:strand:- start:2132 stop:3304 length:1173 start_codon:yes stop_codon:yes gene_type:complete